jgi:RNA polymerase sigma-70 factor (ECF subfamily)
MIRASLLSWEGWVAPPQVNVEVLAVQKGDPDAFTSLVGRYQTRLYRYLLRWVHEPAAAEDLFQQTWMRVIQHIHSFDAKRNFDAWLFAVARNIAIDYLRRRRPASLEEHVGDEISVPGALETGAPGPLDQVLRSEKIETVRRALESQPAVYREILSLRFEEEMKLEEIAEVLCVPLGTVKTRVARALERLRTTFSHMQQEDVPS